MQFLSDDGEVVATQEIERTPEELASEAMQRAGGDVALVPVELREVAVRVKEANTRAIAHCDDVIAGRAPAEFVVFEDGRQRMYRFSLTGPRARGDHDTSVTKVLFPKRRTAAARQRERRSRSGRSSARSGDSGSGDDGPSHDSDLAAVPLSAGGRR